jgi:hypothetical protein
MAGVPRRLTRQWSAPERRSAWPITRGGPCVASWIHESTALRPVASRVISPGYRRASRRLRPPRSARNTPRSSGFPRCSRRSALGPDDLGAARDYEYIAPCRSIAERIRTASLTSVPDALGGAATSFGEAASPHPAGHGSGRHAPPAHQRLHDPAQKPPGGLVSPAAPPPQTPPPCDPLPRGRVHTGGETKRLGPEYGRRAVFFVPGSWRLSAALRALVRARASGLRT